MENEIANPFGRFYNRPLTSDDIAYIEEGMNMLICDLFRDKEDREDALADDLTEKIEGYITIAEYAENDPDLKDIPHADLLKPALHELLKRVKEYYLKAN